MTNTRKIILTSETEGEEREGEDGIDKIRWEEGKNILPRIFPHQGREH